jgi:hypothetical protein
MSKLRGAIQYAHLAPENLRDTVLKLDEKINTNLRHPQKEKDSQ